MAAIDKSKQPLPPTTFARDWPWAGDVSNDKDGM